MDRDTGARTAETNADAGTVESQGTMKLPSILRLPWPKEGSLHPYAHKNYLEFLTEVLKEAPGIYLGGEENLQLFLSDSEYARLEACEDEIKGWLQKCSKDNDEATLRFYPYHSPFNAMWDVKKLLKEVAERKMQKAMREAEEKERQARQEADKKKRLAALKKIDPPFDDAEEHLNKEEQQEFVDSIPGAIDSYLATSEMDRKLVPGVWLFNSKAFAYHDWTRVIRERKQEETREKQRRLELNRYLDRLSLAVEKVKVDLAQNKKPKFVYPAELDKYEPDGWCDLELPSKQKIQKWAEGKILERLPQILTNLTKWELSWERRVMPSAAYEAAGISCLIWYFESYVLVTATLELKTGVIRKRQPGGYTVEVQAKGEKLGTIYLGPVEWLTPGSFTTPIALLSLLAKDELEGPGITVTEHNPPFTTFAVQGLEEEVEVVDGFRAFIKDIAKGQPLAQALLDRGLVDEATAMLIEAKWGQPLPVSSGLGTGGAEFEDVVAKLVELGLAEGDAKKAVETTTLPKNATTEEIVSIILHKSY